MRQPCAVSTTPKPSGCWLFVCQVDGALEFKEQIQGDFKFDELCSTRGFKYDTKVSHWPCRADSMQLG